MITVERLREVTTYDEVTGAFTWRESMSNRVAGTAAGCTTRGRYISIGIDRKKYQAHRLAWLYVHGVWPAQDIDHINGVRSDNRITNLREASIAENNQNQRAPRAGSTSGLLGAHWVKRRKCWLAQIQTQGKNKFLGHYATKELAHAAYLKAKVEMHPFNTLKEIL